MSTINGNNYTNFRGVNVRDGIVKLSDPEQNTTYTSVKVGNYGVSMVVDPKTLTTNRRIYIPDANGSMVIKGYDILYGTSAFNGGSNYAAQTVGQSSITITGLLASCIVLVTAATTAQVSGYVPIGAKYAAADKAWVFYKTQAATAAVALVPINYVALFPQTS
jgi:hypothetical protein